MTFLISGRLGYGKTPVQERNAVFHTQIPLNAALPGA